MLTLLLTTPLIGIFLIIASSNIQNGSAFIDASKEASKKYDLVKIIGLFTTILNLFISFIVFVLFHYSSNQYQFVQEYHQINSFDIYLGVDGFSIYFVLLTTIIMPISLLSN
jgi:NADH-ubiquinone oxidoreductase chain 4